MAQVLPSELLHHLQQMCENPNPMLQQASATHLQTLEGRNGFIPSLVEVLGSSGSSFGPRFLSIICLKNNVDKCWAPRDRNLVISDEDKIAVRMITIHLLAEEEHRLAFQNAVLIARIARHDWPVNWPTIFEDLYGLLTNPTSMWQQQRNALLAIHEVIVMLRSKRLPAVKKQLEETAYAMLPAFVVQLETWMQRWRDLTVVIQTCTGESDVSVSMLGELGRHCTLCIRVVSYLVMLSFKQHHSDADMRKCVSTLASMMEHCTNTIHGNHSNEIAEALSQCDDSWLLCEFNIDNASTSSSDSDDTLVQTALRLQSAVPLRIGQKLVVSIGVVHHAATLCHLPLALLKNHCEHMSNYVSFFLPVIWNVLAAEHNFVLAMPALARVNTGFLIPLCQFLSLILLSNPPPDEAQDDAGILPSNCFVRDFINDTRFCELFNMIQSNYLLFDLSRSGEEWLEDAEEYFVKCQSESEGDSIVNAAQAVVCAMLEFRPALMEQLLRDAISDVDGQRSVVQQVLHCVSSSIDARDGNALVEDSLSDHLTVFPIDLQRRVLQLDGLYTSMCMAPSQLSNVMGGAEWLRVIVGPLLTELGSIRSNNIVINVLRRRLLWVLTCWGYMLTSDQLSEAVDLVAKFMDCSNNGVCGDALVHLSAVECMCSLLHSSDMSSDVLQPIEQRCCRIIYLSSSLAAEQLKQSETQAIAINLVKEAMIICDTALKPHVPLLLRHVLALWECDGNLVQKDDESNLEAPHRIAALDLLIIIVKLSRGSLPEMCKVLHPILYYSLSCGIETLYLADLAMPLWLHLVRNSTTYTAELEDLFVSRLQGVLAADVLSAEVESIRLVANLLDAYVMLGGPNFLCGAGGQVFADVLGGLVCNVVPRGAPCVVKPLESMALVVPSIAPAFLLESGLMTIILRACAAAYFCSTGCHHQKAATLRSILSPHEEADVAVVSYLTVLATCLVHNVNQVHAAAEALVQGLQLPCSARDVSLAVCQLLIDKFDAAGYATDGIWRKKIWCFALMSYFPTTDTELLDFLPSLLRLSADAIAELQTPEGARKMMKLPTILSTVLSEEDLGMDDDMSDGSDVADAGAQGDILCDIFQHFLSQHDTFTIPLSDVVFKTMQCQRNLIENNGFHKSVISQLDPSSVHILRQYRIFD